MWTDELCASLKGLWRSGMATREIGRRLGLEDRPDSGKNAVIGKARRLGLGIHKDANRSRIQRDIKDRSPRPQVRAKRGAYKPRMNKATWRQTGLPKPPQKIVVDIVDTLIPVEQRKSLLDLGPFDCRWPVGDPCKGFHDNPEFFFCGAIAVDDGPYCPAHHKRAHL
jgi:GcrA cell cycle regulator